jgi:hypothetical protein
MAFHRTRFEDALILALITVGLVLASVVNATGSIVHDNDTQPIPGESCDPGFMPPPITTAGAVGFAKWHPANEVVDNFSWTDLSVSR